MSTKFKSPRQIARELYNEQQRRSKAEQALEVTQTELESTHGVMALRHGEESLGITVRAQ